MTRNLDQLITFYKGRDMSPFLFHFVKGYNPLLVLRQIIKDNALKSEMHDFICYTESPLRVMKDVLDYFQTFKDKPNCSPMFEPYGIGIKKKMMYEMYNARPVIYGTIADEKLYGKAFPWRFEQLDFEHRNISWQREWRTEGNYFELPEDDEDVLIICRYEKEVESLKSLTSHPCVSLEWVENNHASDFDVEANASFQMLTPRKGNEYD